MGPVDDPQDLVGTTLQNTSGVLKPGFISQLPLELLLLPTTSSLKTEGNIGVRRLNDSSDFATLKIINLMRQERGFPSRLAQVRGVEISASEPLAVSVALNPPL